MAETMGERPDGRRNCPACGYATYVIVGEPWSKIADLQSQLTAARERIAELEARIKESGGR